MLFFWSCLIQKTAQAQEFESERTDHDELPYYFGLTVGYNRSNLHTVLSDGFYQNGQIKRVIPGASGGIELGLMGTLNLAKHWELRTVPKLVIGGSKYLSYYYDSPSFQTLENIDPANPGYTPTAVYQEDIKLPATIISVPLHVKFNSDRIGNLKAYLFAGLKYDMNLSAGGGDYTKDRNITDPVSGQGWPAPQFRKGTAGYEGGIGLHIYMPFAVISPEIRFSSSLQNDLLQQANNPYSNVFSKFQARMLSFTINIEQ